MASPHNEATLNFDTPEAKGSVTIKRSTYGAEIIVNGRIIGFVDLFYAAQRPPTPRPVGTVALRTEGGDGAPDPLFVAFYQPNGSVATLDMHGNELVLNETVEDTNA